MLILYVVGPITHHILQTIHQTALSLLLFTFLLEKLRLHYGCSFWWNISSKLQSTIAKQGIQRLCILGPSILGYLRHHSNLKIQKTPSFPFLSRLLVVLLIKDLPLSRVFCALLVWTVAENAGQRFYGFHCNQEDWHSLL